MRTPILPCLTLAAAALVLSTFGCAASDPNPKSPTTAPTYPVERSQDFHTAGTSTWTAVTGTGSAQGIAASYADKTRAYDAVVSGEGGPHETWYRFDPRALPESARSTFDSLIGTGRTVTLRWQDGSFASVTPDETGGSPSPR